MEYIHGSQAPLIRVSQIVAEASGTRVLMFGLMTI